MSAPGAGDARQPRHRATVIERVQTIAHRKVEVRWIVPQFVLLAVITWGLYWGYRDLSCESRDEVRHAFSVVLAVIDAATDDDAVLDTIRAELDRALPACEGGVTL